MEIIRQQWINALFVCVWPKNFSQNKTKKKFDHFQNEKQQQQQLWNLYRFVSRLEYSEEKQKYWSMEKLFFLQIQTCAYHPMTIKYNMAIGIIKLFVCFDELYFILHL